MLVEEERTRSDAVHDQRRHQHDGCRLPGDAQREGGNETAADTGVVGHLRREDAVERPLAKLLLVGRELPRPFIGEDDTDAGAGPGQDPNDRAKADRLEDDASAAQEVAHRRKELAELWHDGLKRAGADGFEIVEDLGDAKEADQRCDKGETVKQVDVSQREPGETHDSIDADGAEDHAKKGSEIPLEIALPDVAARTVSEAAAKENVFGGAKPKRRRGEDRRGDKEDQHAPDPADKRRHDGRPERDPAYLSGHAYPSCMVAMALGLPGMPKRTAGIDAPETPPK